jgi:glycoside hydrolase 97
MKHLMLLSLVILTGLLRAQTLSSPNGNLQLTFSLTEEGEPMYSLQYKGKMVIADSKMGFTIMPATNLSAGFELKGSYKMEKDSVWQPVLGEYSQIRDHHNELLVKLQQWNTDYVLHIRFRLFDDGLGFRYEFPEQPHLRHFAIGNEHTAFKLMGNHKAFWLPADYDTNEFPTTISSLEAIPSLIDKVREEPLAAKSPTENVAVQTPLLLKTDDGLYLHFHEAALVDFPALMLNLNAQEHLLTAHLVPDKNGVRGYIQTGGMSPWRTIIVSDDARDIIASNLILNLNEPCKIEDTSWIKPIKYVGVWWEYFIGGGSTWAYKENSHHYHAANTQHVMKYIDFAATHGFDAVLVEGWNKGWEDNVAYYKEHIYSFTEPYPDFDVAQLRNYAASKGIKLIMHHETTSSVVDYERQLHQAFDFMKRNGYDAVKTGYVGPIIPRSEYHDSQWMVNHYNYVAATAASYKIMVNSHEAVRPTGLSRTYPNWIAQESARGTEFESFTGIAPNHTTILPFTRIKGGAMDYTPGIFEGDLSLYGDNKAKLSSTLVKQLALYVTMYSPLQMAADLPENYEKHLDAFQFIKDVATDWDDTYVLEVEPGAYLTIARKAKGKQEWYVGGITNEEARQAVIDFSFLPAGKNYTATIYADGKDADWRTQPKSYKISSKKIHHKTIIKQRLAPSGGVAISIKEDK